MHFDSKISTLIRMVKTGPDGRVLWRGETKNLITDIGLLGFFSGTGADNNVGNNLYLSTATAAPAFTDTSMGGTVVSSNSVSTLFPVEETVWDSANFRFEHRSGRKFTTAGTFGTIGRGPNSTGGTWTKALIRDAGGNPTTVTIQAGEQLDVQYIMIVPLPNVIVTGNVGGIDYEAMAIRGSSFVPIWRGRIPILNPSPFMFGNNAATPPLSLADRGSTSSQLPGWTNPVSGSSSTFAQLTAPSVVGNTVSRTGRLTLGVTSVPVGNVFHGLGIGTEGLFGGIVIRFPNTKPGKTNTQEFRMDITQSMTR